MRLFFPATIICFSLLAGCASYNDMSTSFSAGKGDVGAFILKKATDFGGHVSTTNVSPAIESSWQYFADQEGVVIRTTPNDCQSLEALLYQSFGAPRIAPTWNSDGTRLIAYRLTPDGGGIQLICDARNTQVIILKPQGLKHSENSK